MAMVRGHHLVSHTLLGDGLNYMLRGLVESRPLIVNMALFVRNN